MRNGSGAQAPDPLTTQHGRGFALRVDWARRTRPQISPAQVESGRATTCLSRAGVLRVTSAPSVPRNPAICSVDSVTSYRDDKH